MHSTAGRKAAIRKFKERKPRVGVFAARCTAAAQTWVGAARNLDAAKNRFWFCLGSGVHPISHSSANGAPAVSRYSSTRFWRNSMTICLPWQLRICSRKRNITELRNWMHYHSSALAEPRDPIQSYE